MTTTLNPTQIHLLRMFSADNTEKGLQELKEVLFNYYYEKMNKSLDELWTAPANGEFKFNASLDSEAGASKWK